MNKQAQNIALIIVMIIWGASMTFGILNYFNTKKVMQQQAIQNDILVQLAKGELPSAKDSDGKIITFWQILYAELKGLSNPVPSPSPTPKFR